MSSIYAVKHYHTSKTKVITTQGVKLVGLVVSPFTSADGKIGVFSTRTKAGTYTRSGTTATITLADHGLESDGFVALDWDLADTVYEVAKINNDTFTVTVADSGAVSGSVTVYVDHTFQVDVSDPVVFQIVLPEPGLP